jgi:uncharacterized protein
MARLARTFLILLLASFGPAGAAGAQEPPELTAPVNDFGGVIDTEHEAALDRLIRSLQRASGDVVVVATIDTFAPYGDIREYAVKMFENRGRGIGDRGRDNGLLVLLAVKDRQVWVEVGYDLEEFVTDGFAGETSRQVMIPEFRRGDYGAGLLAGVSRIIGRIAERRQITLQDLPDNVVNRSPEPIGPRTLLLVIFLIFLLLSAMAGRTGRRGRRRLQNGWGAPIGGWNSGVGPFGGGFGRGGGGVGGGFGGGFGGFGGGRSGGGGGGGSW